MKLSSTARTRDCHPPTHQARRGAAATAWLPWILLAAMVGFMAGRSSNKVQASEDRGLDKILNVDCDRYLDEAWDELTRDGHRGMATRVDILGEGEPSVAWEARRAAKRLIERAGVLRPDYWRVYYHQAHWHLAAGDLREARSVFQEAHTRCVAQGSIEAEASLCLTGVAITHHSLGEDQKARDVIREALLLNEDNVGALVQLAILLEPSASPGSVEQQEAEAALERAIEIDPDHGTARHLLGRSLLRSATEGPNNLGNQRVVYLERSSSHFEHALETGFRGPRILCDHALANAHLSRFDVALESASEATRGYPDFSDGWRKFAFCLQQLGRDAEAVDAWNELCVRSPEGSADRQDAESRRDACRARVEKSVVSDAAPVPPEPEAAGDDD